jgi:hypothetical protein
MQTLESALNGPIAAILNKAKKLAAINEMLKVLLDSEIAAHCRAVNLEANKLTIFCDSGAYTTRINFQKPQLLAGLQVQFAEIKNIHCKTDPRR